eukprot:scaffold8431_cov248-Pinguiococcus_pyrenoidosus.AAC.13
MVRGRTQQRCLSFFTSVVGGGDSPCQTGSRRTDTRAWRTHSTRRSPGIAFSPCCASWAPRRRWTPCCRPRPLRRSQARPGACSPRAACACASAGPRRPPRRLSQLPPRTCPTQREGLLTRRKARSGVSSEASRRCQGRHGTERHGPV